MIKTTVLRRGNKVTLMNHKGLHLFLPCGKPKSCNDEHTKSACPHALDENTNQEWAGQKTAWPSEQLIITYTGWYSPWFISSCQRHLDCSQLPIQYFPFVLVALSKLPAEGDYEVREQPSCTTEGQKGLLLCMLRQQEGTQQHSYVFCGDQNYFVILWNPIGTRTSLPRPSWAVESTWCVLSGGS